MLTNEVATASSFFVRRQETDKIVSCVAPYDHCGVRDEVIASLALFSTTGQVEIYTKKIEIIRESKEKFG